MNKSSKCLICQYYDRENDTCKIKSPTEYANQDHSQCTDYLVHDKLIMF